MQARNKALRGDIFVVPDDKRDEFRETIKVTGSTQVHAGQRVRVEGRDEVFVVLCVDAERHVADLLRQTKVRRVEIGVPLKLVHPAEEPDAAGEMAVSA